MTPLKIAMTHRRKAPFKVMMRMDDLSERGLNDVDDDGGGVPKVGEGDQGAR